MFTFFNLLFIFIIYDNNYEQVISAKEQDVEEAIVRCLKIACLNINVNVILVGNNHFSIILLISTSCLASSPIVSLLFLFFFLIDNSTYCFTFNYINITRLYQEIKFKIQKITVIIPIQVILVQNTTNFCLQQII